MPQHILPNMAIDEEVHDLEMSLSPTLCSNTNFNINNTSTVSSDSNDPSSTLHAKPSIGVNLRVTGQCSQGGRKYMEDYFSVAYQQSENAKDLEYAFIGIYDGHGGAEAAIYAKEHLMMEIINQKLFWSDSDHDVLRAIREGYIATHYAMWRAQENWPKTANGLPSTAGTTATVAFIRREKIYIGHVGDSGIVLGYQHANENFWRSKQLTVDHKPESTRERERIRRSGGKVAIKSGVPRVVWNRPRNVNHGNMDGNNMPVDEIPFLAVARSLGDLWSYNSLCNEFIVSPDPDVKVIKIDPKTFRCLIFGTDGLWNVMSPQEAVDTVYEKELLNERLQSSHATNASGLSWTNPSKGLVEKALGTWSSRKMRADNTSVVTVILYPTTTASAVYDGEYSEIESMNVDFPLFNDVISYQDIARKYNSPKEYQSNMYINEININTTTEENVSNEYLWKPIGTEDCYWHNEKHETRKTKNDWLFQTKLATVLNKNVIVPISSKSAIPENLLNAQCMESVEEKDTEIEPECSGFMLCQSNELQSSQICYSDGIEDNFVNNFTEPYNTLLNEHIQVTTDGTNSSATYQSLTNRDMHELIKEQDLYQQECMSEEEGYSLTKLETRREQQHNGVLTYKIYQHEKPAGSEIEFATSNESVCSFRYQNTNVEEYSNPNFIHSRRALELDSLLQQEIAEEQQVALERQEMQHKLIDSTANKSSFECIYSDIRRQNDAFMSVGSFGKSIEEQVTDEKVQINEISSSVKDIFDTNELTTGKISTLKQQLEDTADVHIDLEKSVLNNVSTFSVYCKTSNKCTCSTYANNSTKHLQCASLIGKQNTGKYPISPNENENVPSGASRYKLNNYQRVKVQSNTSKSIVSRSYIHSSNSERRQLRSNSTILDNSKRTLRARNSLSKDLKAKASLTPSHKKSISVTVPILCSASVTHIEQAKYSNKYNRMVESSIEGERCKTAAPSNMSSESLNSNIIRFINLRPRKMKQCSSKTSTHILQIERKSKHKMNLQKSSALSDCDQRSSRANLSKDTSMNYSKSTRVQASETSFSLQAPSYKLIDSKTTAATPSRTRNLLSAVQRNKSVASITALYGDSKRPNLRSNRLCNGFSNTSSSTSLYRNTRSRASKVKH